MGGFSANNAGFQVLCANLRVMTEFVRHTNNRYNPNNHYCFPQSLGLLKKNFFFIKFFDKVIVNKVDFGYANPIFPKYG